MMSIFGETVEEVKGRVEIRVGTARVRIDGGLSVEPLHLNFQTILF